MSFADRFAARRRTLLIVLAIALAVVVALNIAGRLRPEDAVETVDTGGDVISVVEVLSAPEGVLRTVRGFVFEDAVGLRLCQGRQTEPVSCVGPYLDLVGFDLASVPTRSTESGGREIFYSEEPVTVVGTLSLTTLTVEELVAGG